MTTMNFPPILVPLVGLVFQAIARAIMYMERGLHRVDVIFCSN